MKNGIRTAKLVSRRECKRMLKERLPGKHKVSEAAVDKVEKAALEELDCIVLENTQRPGVTIV